MVTTAEPVDVVVVGLGAFGSAIAWRLAARGVSVIGVERHSVPNDLGSSHGQTRIFRTVSQNHVSLYSMAMLSRRLWLELEDESGDELLAQTGAMVVGHKDQGRIADTNAVIAAHDLHPRVLDADEIRREYPVFGNVADDEVAILDDKGGALFPEKCVAAAADAAGRSGAQLLENTEVFGHVRDGDGVVVQTSAGDLRAARVVYATGSWTAKLFPELGLDPLRIPQTWFTYSGESNASPSIVELPPFQRDLQGVHGVWGHGAAAPGWLTKIGTHGHPFRNRTVDTDNIDREVHPEDIEYLSKLVAHSFPVLNPVPAESDICLLNESADEQFALGPITDPHVLVAAGESGQGFKHATGVGEIIADLCLGVDSEFDRSFMNASRLITNS